MSAQEILQSPLFSERFDTPHHTPVLAPVIRKRKAEALTFAGLCLIVTVPFAILVHCRHLAWLLRRRPERPGSGSCRIAREGQT